MTDFWIAYETRNSLAIDPKRKTIGKSGWSFLIGQIQFCGINSRALISMTSS